MRQRNIFQKFLSRFLIFEFTLFFFFFVFRLKIILLSSEVLRDSSLDTVEVQKDDIIILSSDGLWDVIKNDQLNQIVKKNAHNVI